MTATITIDLKRHTPSGDEALTGTMEWRPTERHIIDDTLYLPHAFLLPVYGVLVLDIPASTVDWCWKVTERFNGNTSVHYYEVPEGASNYGDLVELDPNNLTGPILVPLWRASFDSLESRVTTLELAPGGGGGGLDDEGIAGLVILDGSATRDALLGEFITGEAAGSVFTSLGDGISAANTNAGMAQSAAAAAQNDADTAQSEVNNLELRVAALENAEPPTGLAVIHIGQEDDVPLGTGANTVILRVPAV